jgi:hypothetical protein
MASGVRICAFSFACVSCIAGAFAENPLTLKDKSNEELLHIMLGGKTEWRIREDAKVKAHLPEKFWEMPPKDAALKLVEDNCSPELKQKWRLSFLDDNKQPPARGEVAFTYLSEFYDSSLSFKYSAENSRLSFSVGNRTKSIPLAQPEARQIYETIWWLCHVRGSESTQASEATPAPDEGSTEATAERMVSSDPVMAIFRVSPYLRKTRVTLYFDPLSDWYVNGINRDLHATLTDLVLDDALKKQGIDWRTMIPKREKEKITDPDEKFVRESAAPNPQDLATTKRWVERMLVLLRNTKHLPRSWIIERLVPSEDPMRYKDERIDSALIEFVNRGLEVQKRKSASSAFNALIDAGDAARALAWRDRADIFPKLIELLNGDVDLKHNEIEESAAWIASKHSELRTAMVEQLRNHLMSSAVWRGDFRELAPDLEKIATTSPDEIEPERSPDARFHRARAILTDWRETDPLTKLKLDAILNASECCYFRVPEFMYREYAALSSEDQHRFREFVEWLDKHRAESGIVTTESVHQLIGLNRQTDTAR